MTITGTTDRSKKSDLQIFSFPSAKELASWLEQNHDKSKGIWLRMYKKDSAIVSVYYKEALDEALCFGWIDGQARKYDDNSYLQRLTPRRAKSIWSKRNIENIQKKPETREKRMKAILEMLADEKKFH